MSRAVTRTWMGFFATALTVAVVVACSAPDPNARFVETPPDATSFPAVAGMLVQACGSLDCHGQVGRNLRLYGDTGLRSSATDVPSVAILTTSYEVTQDYDSVVGLEPELMSQVVASHGADPGLLTFYRKPRGLESHKGGTVIQAGDARDRCITTWLQGSADPDACNAALLLP